MRFFRRGAQSGASAVEFGLVLPLLVVILLGLIDYGWVFFVRLNMTNAAREGARVGVTRSDPTEAMNVASTTATNYLAAAALSLSDYEALSSWQVPAGSTNENCSVRVVVKTKNEFHPLVGFVPTPNSMTVSAQMRWELAKPESCP